LGKECVEPTGLKLPKATGVPEAYPVPEAAGVPESCCAPCVLLRCIAPSIALVFPDLAASPAYGRSDMTSGTPPAVFSTAVVSAYF